MRHKDFKDKYGVHNLLVCKIKDPSYKKDFFVYYTESGIAWSAGEELDSYEDKDVEEDYGDVNFEVVDWFDETSSSVEEEHNPKEMSTSIILKKLFDSGINFVLIKNKTRYIELIKHGEAWQTSSGLFYLAYPDDSWFDINNCEVVDWFDETSSSVEEEHNPKEKCIFNGCEARVNYIRFCNGCAHDLTMAREKGQTVVNEIAISIIPQQRRCECGSEACGYTTHSTWCPKHV